MSASCGHRVRIGESIGPYRIDGLLGTGGMGRVYVAFDTRLKRTVAIKVVDRVPENQLALLREARFAAALNHPAICTVHEIGTIDDEPFIVMEHVRGVPLWSVIQNRGAVPLESALSYEMQIADAMAHAHDRGVVHGDLKSSNIMVVDARYRSVRELAADLDDLGCAPWRMENDPDRPSIQSINALPRKH